MKKNIVEPEAEILRQKAEEMLFKNTEKNSSRFDEVDMQRLIHELQVHQIELEMQNAELIVARSTAQKTADKYTDLYDFAPSGYFTLSNSGEIIELNFSGAKMLGKVRSHLINSQFGIFVSKDTKATFNLFLNNVFNNKVKQTCEVILSSDDDSQTYVSLSGVINEDGEQCLMTALDFTERKQLEDFNEMLLTSLPYPAMYIRQKDRIIIAANKIALDLGAKIGEQCWQVFGKLKFISQQDNEIATKYPNLVPEKFGIKCSFCLGDECILASPTQNNQEVNAFDRIWDTYWIKVSKDVFLHYMVDITERKRMEEALRESEIFLKQTQQIAMLGTFTIDLPSESWVGSEVLDSIFGLNDNFDKTFKGWKSIIHPDWEKRMNDYFRNYVIANKTKFDKEFKIIRQSDQAERWVHGIADIEFNAKNEPIKMIGTIQDITDRKNEQSQIIRTLQFTEALLKSIPIPVFFTDSNGVYTGCNESFTLMMGFSNDQLKGKTVKELWPGEQAEIYYLNDIDLLATQVNQTFEVKITDKENKIRDVIFVKNVYYDENSQVAGIVGAFIDITDRKLIEDLLRKSEQMLLTVMDQFPGVIFWKDKHSNYLGCNNAFAISVGLINPSEIIGKTDFDLHWYETEARDKRADDYEVMEEGKTKKHIVEKRLQNDNKETWFDTTKIPLRESGGQVIGMIGVSNDITERKKAEEALWLKNIIFDASIAANSIAGLDFNITEANDSFPRYMHYSKKDDVIGKNISDFFNDTNEADTFATTLTDTGQWEGDFTAKRGDGSTFIAHAIASVVHDKNGCRIGFQSSIIDVTDEKQAEAALRKSEQMLITVLDQFPGVVFWKDQNSNYLGCNQAFAIGAGLKNPSEIIGKTDFDLPWSETEVRDYRADDYEVMENGKSKLHIVEMQHQVDGRVAWFDTSKIPLRESGGLVIGVIGVSNDISERVKVEENLRESEEKFRTLAEFTNDWEYWIDQHQNFLYCSPSCEEITGYKAAEFKQNPGLLFDIVYPDDQIIFHYHKQMEDVAFEVSEEVQYRIIHLDGTIKWIGHVCQPIFDASGKYIGIRGSNRDITKRKETEQLLKTSQQKYKLLSENITDGIFICKNGSFEYVNRGMSVIFGYGYHELEGLKLLDSLLHDYPENLENFITKDSPSNQILDIEVECFKKNHTKVYIEMYLNYVADEKVIYGVVHDVTEKKQIQKKNIVKAIIQTEEQEKANFSKELHDGLGPLLSTIKLYLQWSERPNSNKSRKEIILKAEDILKDALTAVKEISNKLSPHLLTNYGLSSAIQSFVNNLKETNAIKINFQSNASRRIEMEIEVALYRAIIECINNTIKYAKAKNIYIVLNDMGNQIQLQYKDDGIGFNIPKTLSEKKGLGLFNLQNRIQTIGGKIKMLSEPGHGIDYHIIVNL